jgi:hypothetical protein
MRLGWRQGLWLAIWFPWWCGNEVAAPSAPGSRAPEIEQPLEGSAGAWILDTLDDLRFRFGLVWTFALALRGAWLGGLVGIAWLVVSGTSTLPAPSVLQLALVASSGVAVGLLLRLFHRPTYLTTGLLLERSFGLQSRLMTGVLALHRSEDAPAGLRDLQLADAANALDRARRLLTPNHWIPVRELFILISVALTLLLMLVAQRPEGDVPALSAAGFPKFVPVSERLADAGRSQEVAEIAPNAETLEQVEEVSRTSNQARIDLETVGDALSGNAVTSPAGSSIESGNYPEANRQLNDASQSVTQLPADQREALADDLDEAADQISEDNAALAEAASDASDDVREGEDTGALGELGDQIQDTGDAVVGQESRNGDLSSSQSESQPGSQSGESGGESGSSQPQESGNSGEAPGSQGGDPGAGMDASSGVGQSGEDGQPSDSGGSGEPGADGGNPSAAEGGAEAPANGSSDAAGEGARAETSADNGSGTGQTSGAPNEEDGESGGTGAGAGQTGANDETELSDAESGGGGDLDNDEQAPDAGQGEAGDPPTGGTGDGEGSEGQNPTGGASSITLPGTSDDRVSSGSDVGSSSVGSGGGVGAGSGSSSGNASGSAGPDPNDVPAQWRSVVEEYFRNGGAP